MISSRKLLLTPCDTLPLTSIISLSTSLILSEAASLLNSFSRSAISSFSLPFDLRSLMMREKSFLSITTPCIEGGALREASFTSPALSPKIARSSFSSGVGSDSPLGVIFPIRISPSFTSAPMRIKPFSSRFLVASVLTLGMSLVSSSTPRRVSRTSSTNSSMCTEVKMSSFTTFSEITMASSKL